MRLLVLNWQDHENPQAGGAELHLREIFTRIVAGGHSVDLLCSGWSAASPRTELDGISVHRVGTRHTYPFLARRYYSAVLASNSYDCVIEDLNKVPLYSPLWGTRRLVALVHHLFGATAFRETPFPLAAALWLAERPLGVFYRRVPFQAVSESTAQDLVSRGIPRTSIRVIYNGVDAARLRPDSRQRSRQPLFVHLGRLKKYKRVDIVIRAFAQLGIPDATLEIAGTGDYRASLEALVESLGLGNRVRFLGFISEAEKASLLRRAWASAIASPKEGWGIVNLEAAACGTPVIAADSPGIRESVKDEQTGFLVRSGDVGAMARAMRRIAQSPALVAELGLAGRQFAESFTWERSARDTLRHLEEVVDGGGPAELISARGKS